MSGELPGIGIGVQVGPLRSDWGNGFADLRCDVRACAATWVGEPGEACGWCIRWLELANETQRKVLLRPDLPAGDDEDRRERATLAWVDRLAAAVKAGIVTEHEALKAVRRVEGRRAA